MASLPEPRELLPHREPFLFVDELLSIDEGKGGVGRWTPPTDAWFVQGYPGAGLVPPTILLESLAQMAACVAAVDPRFAGRTPVLARMDDVSVPGPITAGEPIELVLSDAKLSTKLGKGKAVARRGDQDLAEVTLTFVVVEARD